MVNKFANILNKIIESGIQVVFFGIFKMDDITDKWSVIFAASDVSIDNRDVYFEKINNLMIEELTSEERSYIARTGIFNSDAHLIQLLLDYKDGYKMTNEKVNGNTMHEGYVFYSKKELLNQNDLFAKSVN